MIPARQFSFQFPVSPDLRDHRFRGKIVLPAVASMEILAQAALNQYPDINPHVILNASFPKFLEIPPEADSLPVNISLSADDQGTVRAELSTFVRVKNSGINRTLAHAAIVFRVSAADDSPPAMDDSQFSSDPMFELSAADLYAELVPFGPAYHTVQNRLLLTETRAEALLCANRHHSEPCRLGSPFILDGAFHAACAWGQRYAGVIGFPLSFKARHIFIPLNAGQRCRALILPINRERLQFEANIFIMDDQGACGEAVEGVIMRDVSAGRIKPPDWIRASA